MWLCEHNVQGEGLIIVLLQINMMELPKIKITSDLGKIDEEETWGK